MLGHGDGRHASASSEHEKLVRAFLARTEYVREVCINSDVRQHLVRFAASLARTRQWLAPRAFWRPSQVMLAARVGLQRSSLPDHVVRSCGSIMWFDHVVRSCGDCEK